MSSSPALSVKALKDSIRHVPDFPKPGILFYDISTLLANHEAWQSAIDRLASLTRKHQPDILVGIESRGFLMAAPLAAALGIGLVMIRKAGKLPGRVISHTYDLEYGTDTIEIQADLIAPGTRVVVIDDLLATGGTATAAINLLRRVSAQPVAAVFLIELLGLTGRHHIDIPVTSLLSYTD